VGTGVLSVGVKRPERKTDHPSPSHVEVELYCHSSLDTHWRDAWAQVFQLKVYLHLPTTSSSLNVSLEGFRPEICMLIYTISESEPVLNQWRVLPLLLFV
jgi:hypothetical protein